MPQTPFRRKPGATKSRATDLSSIAFGAAEFEVNGEAVLATTAGAAFLPDQNTLLVADLHFEKGTAYGRHGQFLPPYDTRATLKQLSMLCRAFSPARVVSLGDAFHDVEAEARMNEQDASALAALIRGREWTWILGNHDPLPPARFAADVGVEDRVGKLVLRHEPRPRHQSGDVRSDQAATLGEVAGHLHPCAKVRAESRVIRRRCFATDGTRMILPAFGAYTGGLNILDEAYEGLFEGATAWVLGGKGVYAFPADVLVPDTVRSQGSPGKSNFRRAG